MVSYKTPVLVQAGVTLGFDAGVNVNTFDGTNGSEDWRGYEIRPEKDGFGSLKIDIEYTWDKVLGIWTLLNGQIFDQQEFYHVAFDLAGYISPSNLSQYPSGFTQYPHWIVIKDSNWTAETETEVGRWGRYETGAGAKKGFDDPDVNPKGVIYFALPMYAVEIGTPIEVYYTIGGRLKAADTSKQFSEGQLNARVWL